MALFVGTDIGGTFTDLVGYDSTCDAVFFGKTSHDCRRSGEWRHKLPR